MDANPVKILVVDDEASICELMKINLELAGYAVDVAYSAESALQMDLYDGGNERAGACFGCQGQ